MTPSKTGYNFLPVNQIFNNVTSDKSQNFVAAKITPDQYTLTMAVNHSDWGGTIPSAGTHTYDENISLGDKLNVK